jgi:hypothetical protein
VSLLTSVDRKNIIDMMDNEDEQSAGDTPPTSSLPPSSYSFRARRATQGKLVYDTKYHPMDDSIRPSQAAKRRSLHGETQCFSDDTVGPFCMYSETDEEDGHYEELEHLQESSKRGKKRARRRSPSPQPTRRSPRKTSNPKVSYNTSIHPQDHDLEASSADEDESETACPPLKRHVHMSSGEDYPVSPSRSRTEGGSVLEIGSDATTGEDTWSQSHGDGISEPDEGADVPEEGLDVWMMKPGERYFRHDRHSWPSSQGLSFEIYTERLEDQLAAEANAASPLNYEQDDKENEVTDSTHEEASGSTQGISVMPLLQYRRTTEDNIASEAFYSLEHALTSPYGLGGIDGIHEHYDEGMRKTAMAEAMSILTSGNKSPRKASEEQAEDADSVQCLPSGAFSDADSILGRT